MSSEANLQLIREWVETIWNEAQFDQLPRFHPPIFHNHGNPTTIEEVRQWHVRMRATYPDLHYTIDDIFSAGDRVALRWTATGTQRGSLWGLIPATNKTVTWSGIHLLCLADDQIVEVCAVADTTAVLQQLGVKLLPPDEGSA